MKKGFFSPLTDLIADQERDKEFGILWAKVLDESVRPAIRQASQEICLPGKGIEFCDEGPQPSIRIGMSAVRFVCRGDSLRIVTKIEPLPPDSETIALKEVTVNTVAESIALFFAQAFNLPSHKLPQND